MKRYAGVSGAITAAVVVLLLGSAVAAAQIDTEIIDDFSGGTKAARAVWNPMSGSPEVTVATVDGKQALRMACSFQDSRIERASWDRKVSLDLSGRKGVRFYFRSEGVSSVGSFSIYFRSGGGWYNVAFDAPGTAGWGVAEILKKNARLEGTPGGWGKIDLIRISAWRGGNTNCEFQIAGLQAFGGGGRIAIIRGDAAARGARAEVKSVDRYANVVATLLESAGLNYTILSDADVTPARLKKMQLAILPHNPVVPDNVTKALAEFLDRDGKLIACYSMPGSLAEKAGIRMGRHTKEKYKGYFASIRPETAGRLEGMPDITRQGSWNICNASAIEGKSRVAARWFTDAGKSTVLPAVILSDKCAFVTHVLMSDDQANKQQLLLSLAGRLVPDIWRDAARGALDRAGRFEPYKDRQSVMQAISFGASIGSPAIDALKRAGALEEKAAKLMKAGKYAETVTVAAELRQTLIEGHCLMQRSVPGEQRAFWCHSAFGVSGMTWDQAIKKLSDHGFNAILPNMLWGAAAYYKSDVLPVSPQVKTRGDQIALCLAACRKYKVACHVWKVNFYMGRATPPEFARKVRAAGRTQIHFDGSSISDWLCPSHPDNRKLEIDSMVEVARKYAVDGLHFDYIRYPGAHGCFCGGCRKRFEASIGAKVANWPADLRSNDALRARWLDFRRQQITAVVAGVSQQARKIRPEIKISAAVFANWPADRDRIGQDWKLWCDKEYLDFVCPMDYTPQTGTFAQLVARQVKWAGRVPVCPGIGASVWTPRSDPCKVVAQIRAARKAGARGFTIFNYSSAEANELLPMLSKGITAKPQVR